MTEPVNGKAKVLDADDREQYEALRKELVQCEQAMAQLNQMAKRREYLLGKIDGFSLYIMKKYKLENSKEYTIQPDGRVIAASAAV